jgi:hypothetical protein
LGMREVELAGALEFRHAAEMLGAGVG